MKQARQRSNDRTEQALIDWASWAQSSLDAQGWGGGAERDVVTNYVYGRPTGGGTADPVFNEVVATLQAGQGQNQRVHGHLVRYCREISSDWYWVVRARFVGKREVTSEQVMEAHGTAEIARHHYVPISISAKVPKTWKWSGLQCWEDVSKQTGIPERTAKAIFSQVKRALAQDLRMDDEMRRKHPGLMPTQMEAAELERIAVERAAREHADAEERYARAA